MGFGKTLTALLFLTYCALIAAADRWPNQMGIKPTLAIVPSGVVLHQWRDAIKLFPNLLLIVAHGDKLFGTTTNRVSRPKGVIKVHHDSRPAGLVSEGLRENTIALRRVSSLLARSAPVSFPSSSPPSMCVRCIKFTPIVSACVRKSSYHNCDRCAKLHRPCLKECSWVFPSASADLYSCTRTYGRRRRKCWRLRLDQMRLIQCFYSINRKHDRPHLHEQS